MEARHGKSLGLAGGSGGKVFSAVLLRAASLKEGEAVETLIAAVP